MVKERLETECEMVTSAEKLIHANVVECSNIRVAQEEEVDELKSKVDTLENKLVKKKEKMVR